ncbi:MAG: hypothetical protein JM58_12210 [Peptococcaceae bacterium BICA1-8]|nr:MAG: hypothetical protein JM58_12210 [Peptococcaceae bacterium BICA1-8]
MTTDKSTNNLNIEILKDESLTEISKIRELDKWQKKLVFIVSIMIVIFHLYGLYIKPIDPWIFRAGHLVLASMLLFMLIPATKKTSLNKISAVDFIWIILSVSTLIYLIIKFDGLILRAGGPSPEQGDIIFGTIALLIVLEMMRRSTGYLLPILAITFIIYALIGNYLPGLFWHRGYSFQRIISFLYSTVGIYTIPLGVSARYVFIFILFGAFLQRSGAGDFFVNLAVALTGKTRGGVGKVPILSSALFGTVSGAAVANVVMTGSITIPAMKKSGFKPKVAAAIEAVASTGGQIAPPVMGAAAFLMAEFVGISYSKIVIAAIIPAILYYLSIYWMVDFDAAANGLKSIDVEKGYLKNLLRKDGYLLIPLLVLIYALVIGQASPNKAALWAIISTILIGFARKADRLTLKGLFDTAASSAKGLLEITPVVAGSGIIVGMMSLTGLGLRTANIILSFAGNSLILALFLSMLICILLGMGMPTVAAYATAAAVIPAALVKLGVPELAAHMFIFYFCILATITPPVAMASYAAAALANAKLWDVGWLALKMGVAGFIIPYMFVYGPQLLMIGSGLEIVGAFISAIIGVTALAGAVQGWFYTKANIVQRLLLFIGAFTLIRPGIVTDAVGIGMVIAVLIWQISINMGYFRTKQVQAEKN